MRTRNPGSRPSLRPSSPPPRCRAHVRTRCSARRLIRPDENGIADADSNFRFPLPSKRGGITRETVWIKMGSI
jgi:hypothetical protein